MPNPPLGMALFTYLEDELCRKLKLARRQVGIDTAGHAASRGVDAGSWITGIDVVECVESVHPELRAEALADRNALRY